MGLPTFEDHRRVPSGVRGRWNCTDVRRGPAQGDPQECAGRAACVRQREVELRAEARRGIERAKVLDELRILVARGQELEGRGIHVRAGSMSGLAEEAPAAYKDVNRVVEVVHKAGIAKKVARLKPLAVIKG